MELSIVIVNYKSWEKLAHCLDSLMQYAPKFTYEIIVVDNHSSDNKFGIFAGKYPEVKFILNDGNNGFSNGCNVGADASAGKYLLFLNPDIVLTSSDTLDRMLTFLKTHQDVGIVSCEKINSKEKLEREITFFNPWLTIGLIRTVYKIIYAKKLKQAYDESSSVWYPDWITGSVMMMQKALFNKIGKFDEDSFWMYFEDVALCKKVKDANLKVALLRDVSIKHLHGASSRVNLATTALAKTEVIISSHVYINKYPMGAFSKTLLHLSIAFKVLFLNLVLLVLTSPVFWKPVFRTKFLLLKNMIKYYFKVVLFNEWKSSRLKTKSKKSKSVEEVDSGERQSRKGRIRQNVKIYFINLDQSVERRAFMEQQLSEAGVSYTRVPAVNGSKLDASIKERIYDRLKRANVHYTFPKDGEIGVYMSHRNIWKKILDQEEDFALVFEDDALIDQRLFEDLDLIKKHITPEDVVDISGNKGFLALEKRSVAEKISLTRYSTRALRLQGTLVGKKAAQRLIDTFPEYTMPVDNMLQLAYMHKIPMWTTNEVYVKHNDKNLGGTTIQIKEYDLKAKLYREVSRPLYRMKTIMKNLFFVS